MKVSRPRPRVAPGTGGATGSVAAVNLVNNGQLVVNRNVDLILSSVITGSGGLAQNGPSILDLNAANTFTGDTTIASMRVPLCWI